MDPHPEVRIQTIATAIRLKHIRVRSCESIFLTDWLCVVMLLAVYAIRYAWPFSGDSCCPQETVRQGLEICRPAACPVLSANTNLPMNGFFATLQVRPQFDCSALAKVVIVRILFSDDADHLIDCRGCSVVRQVQVVRNSSSARLASRPSRICLCFNRIPASI